MSERRLVSTQRIVAAEASEPYEEAWGTLRSAAAAADARAWRFHAASDPSHFIEFLEFGGSDDPRTRPNVAQAIERLEQIAAGEVQEWRDASQAPRKSMDNQGDR